MIRSCVYEDIARHLQFRWAVFGIFRILFLAYSAEIPEYDSAIAASTSKNSFFKGMPR